MEASKKVNLPADGFIKAGTGSRPNVDGEQKAQLIRRGNELFNKGQYELAERIFLTLGYSDGLVRVGDVYFKRRDYQKAIKLYMKAPDPGRVDRVAKRMAQVLRQWLVEAGVQEAKPWVRVAQVLLPPERGSFSPPQT